MDHYAFTVPDLNDAVAFFTDVLGGELCYREGPVEAASGDWMTRKLGVHPRARAHVALVRLGPYSNLELFEYSAPGQVTSPPGPSDVGGHHLALRVVDLDSAEEHLRANDVVRLGPAEAGEGPEEARRWFLSPWGMMFALCGPPSPTAGRGTYAGRFVPARTARGEGPLRLLGVDHVGYTVVDLDAATDFFTDVLGAEIVEWPPASVPTSHRPPGTERERRVVLRTGPTANVELSQCGTNALRTRPPRNSDVGGHHLAFYVDDVDTAAAYLRRQPGVTLMGEPETIASGPIAGDRWLYFGTATGIQMELINMPDGALPYEAQTTARRATPGRLRWHDRP
ncbi:VOC family protein [Streptomyces beihaiensis]|uniref:VOC family protein n=1 Tax=Streptomyces beihaiensis TaxID=2984495 RepID=A0ABT3TWD2_9ACTN|nr:VOC family protein [Streptomyces beihaiensis]MCX3061095.1 VOC family protein [Streptomyces beihaiensis]